MKNSYFIIFYVGENSEGKCYGHVAFEYKSKFPNRIETEKTICENYNVQKCIITNLIKISKVHYSGKSMINYLRNT